MNDSEIREDHLIIYNEHFSTKASKVPAASGDSYPSFPGRRLGFR